MSGTSGCRPKRKRKLKTESDVPISISKKWRAEEMDTLLDCIMKNGHKNFQKLKECLPGRTLESIKMFMRTVYDIAGKQCDGHPSLDFWINCCMSKSCNETPWRDSMQIAQVLKYLSFDGLLESHPLPERSQGINFGEAYRLVYQALMGYPIQPVNEPTAIFIQDTLRELTNEVKAEVNAIQSMTSFLTEKSKSEVINTQYKSDAKDTIENPEKPLKVYQRKTPKSLGVSKEVPALKVAIELKGMEDSTQTQNYLVTIEGSQTQFTMMNVSVPVAKPHSEIDKDIEELQTKTSYNPFKLPAKWLQEPLYLNLH